MVDKTKTKQRPKDQVPKVSKNYRSYVIANITRKRQDLLDKYFLARARKELESVTEDTCSWCDKFQKLDFQVCLNCGQYFYEKWGENDKTRTVR